MFFPLEIPSLLTLFCFQFPIQVKVTKTLEFILKAVFSSQQWTKNFEGKPLEDQVWNVKDHGRSNTLDILLITQLSSLSLPDWKEDPATTFPAVSDCFSKQVQLILNQQNRTVILQDSPGSIKTRLIAFCLFYIYYLLSEFQICPRAGVYIWFLASC